MPCTASRRITRRYTLRSASWGNLAFLLGSILFLKGDETVAIAFFIAGSLSMLIGSLGSALVEARRKRS